MGTIFLKGCPPLNSGGRGGGGTYYVLSKLIIEMGMAVYRVAVVSVA